MSTRDRFATQASSERRLGQLVGLQGWFRKFHVRFCLNSIAVLYLATYSTARLESNIFGVDVSGSDPLAHLDSVRVDIFDSRAVSNLYAAPNQDTNCF